MIEARIRIMKITMMRMTNNVMILKRTMAILSNVQFVNQYDLLLQLERTYPIIPKASNCLPYPCGQTGRWIAMTTIWMRERTQCSSFVTEWTCRVAAFSCLVIPKHVITMQKEKGRGGGGGEMKFGP